MVIDKATGVYEIAEAEKKMSIPFHLEKANYEPLEVIKSCVGTFGKLKGSPKLFLHFFSLAASVNANPHNIHTYVIR